MPQAASTSADDVRVQLQRIVQSRAFRAAESLRSLLAFVVDETLAGREENLKEYLLGAMVLRKGATFRSKGRSNRARADAPSAPTPRALLRNRRTARFSGHRAVERDLRRVNRAARIVVR